MPQSRGVRSRFAIVGINKGRGRPKKFWKDTIIQDMKHLQLTEEITLDKKV